MYALKYIMQNVEQNTTQITRKLNVLLARLCVFGRIKSYA